MTRKYSENSRPKERVRAKPKYFLEMCSNLSAMALPVHIWSDIVCPWCFVGKRRFERAVRELGIAVEVTWHSFELDPSQKSLGLPSLSAPERLSKKHGIPLERALSMMEQMKATGVPEGIDFHLEEGKTLSSFDAHRLLHFAAEHGKQDMMKERLFRAHFEEARDVSDRKVLEDLAREVGLPEGETHAVLTTARYAEDVRKDEADARELGISGVPFFVIGRYGVSGAQASATFVQILERAAQEQEENDANPGGEPRESDSCDASGC